MATGIPAMTDEFHREESACLASRRWVWNQWIWLGGLACLIGLVTLFEVRILWRESVVAKQLALRGYHVEHQEGWLRRLLPTKWSRHTPLLFGDRIVALRIDYPPRDLKPIDDLIPQLQKLECLSQLLLLKRSDFPFPIWQPVDNEGRSVLTSCQEFDRCLVTLKTVSSVKTIYLSSFNESQLSDEFITSLQAIDVEQITFLACQFSCSAISRLKTLPRLREVLLLACEDSEAATRQLKLDRPDINIEIAP